MNIKKIFCIMLASLTLPAFAIPLTQRNCSPDDIQFVSKASYQTTCSWKQDGDSTMQVTLHADKATVPLINASCIFTAKDKDIISKILGKKAAIVTNSKIDNNNITFQIINTGSEANLNIVFYLNNKDGSGPYTPGNQLLCSFSSALVDE